MIMASSILVTATERGSGKSTIALGLVHLLESSLAKVGYFKPIGRRDDLGSDPDVRLMKDALGLDFSLEEMAPVTMGEVQEALSRGTYDQLLDTILEAYERIADKCDFVICEGTDYFGAMAAFEFDINADISRNLSSPVLLVTQGLNSAEADGGDQADDQIDDRAGPCGNMIKNVALVKEHFDAKGCEMFGVVINRTEPKSDREFHDAAELALQRLGLKLLGTIPRTGMLSKLRVEEVVDALGAKVISGHDRLNVAIQDVSVAGMTVEHALERIPRGSLVVVAGDRDDVLLGLAAAFVSPSVPAPAGVIMTGGLEPRKNVMNLLLDVTGRQMPLLQVQTNTYQTAIGVNKVQPSLQAHQRMRIELVKTLVESNVDVELLIARASVQPKTRRATPKQFIHRMVHTARKDRRHIVLPEGMEPRILHAAHELLDREIVDLTVLGDPDQIRREVGRLGLKPHDELRIIDPATSDLREGFAKRYIELRSPKRTPTWEMSFDLMSDPTYFSTMMVQEGLADGMVSGSVTTTAATLRPALEFVKTKEGFAIASSVFFMCLPDQVLVYGDCAVNPNPTAEQLADIALASAETARAFGIDPLVAMLSYSTGASGTGSEVDKVREATALVRERNPDLPVEGPIQYDAAIDPRVAETKLPGSKVAGAATVFIFPDLNSGNNTYKAVQRAAKAIAIGPVMQGLKKPVNDLSRGCSIPDIINTVVITAIQAQRT
ncbi:MAG: phosphate acetyltransferase [Deltaproteobacteria bacterium]|nr:MAG: phosphate acetyltransferase [Deltaproteobacteria bacterium]